MKAAVICSTKLRSIITEEEISKIFNNSLLNCEDSDLREGLQTIRNEAFEDIKDLYKNSKIDPFLHHMILNNHKLQNDNKILFDYLLNGFQFSKLDQTRHKILELPIVKKKSKVALEKINEFVYSYFEGVSVQNEQIKKDLKSEPPNTDNLDKFEKLYWKYVANTRSLFKLIRNSVKSLTEEFSRHLGLDIQNLFVKKLDRKIFEIVSQENLNQEFGFLDSNRILDIGMVYDYLQASGLMEPINSNRYIFLFDYLNPDNPANHSGRLMLI
jgi:hypothetical protein